MAYSIEASSNDCYENSNVLINKFNIQNEEQLQQLEQSITSALIAKALVETPFENVDFLFYKKLHEYVFSDIYEWAGKSRIVNLSKKGTQFCDCKKIEELGKNIFENLKASDYLKTYNDADFLNEFTELYCTLNYLHPFREGNGRIQRLFLCMLLKNIGKKINFSGIDKDLFMIATIKSSNGDVFLLKEIFEESIKYEVN